MKRLNKKRLIREIPGHETETAKAILKPTSVLFSELNQIESIKEKDRFASAIQEIRGKIGAMRFKTLRYPTLAFFDCIGISLVPHEELGDGKHIEAPYYSVAREWNKNLIGGYLMKKDPKKVTTDDWLDFLDKNLPKTIKNGDTKKMDDFMKKLDEASNHVLEEHFFLS